MKTNSFWISNLVPSITTLDCYVCNSNENSNCANAGSLDKFKERCPSTPDSYCRKIVQTGNEKNILKKERFSDCLF